MGARPSSFTLTTPGAVRMFSTTEMLNMKAPEWIIEGILPTKGLVGLYGAPGVKKSFLALDFALSIASGTPWQGRAVRRGHVLYVVAEGSAGMGKRIRAWLLNRALQPRDVPVAWLPEAIPIMADSEGMNALISRIDDELGWRPALIILDTLARCLEGDENQQQDMGRFIGGVDRLRQAFDATVIIVHHTRLDGDRERGSTAFRGAADTMLSLAMRKSQLILTCNKQKDAEEFEEIELRVKSVPVADSIVIVPAGAIKRTERKTAMLDVLEELGPLSWDAWFSSMQAVGMARTSFHRKVVELAQNDEIIKEKGLWRVFSSTS